MRIGLLAPPWVPVPPPAYGGTEGVIDRLARGLAAHGHDVQLFTVGESTCPVPRGWRYPHAMTPLENSVVEAAHVLSAYDALDGVDVLHDHTALGPLLAASRHRTGVVATIHSPFTADVRRIYRAASTAAAIVCISHDQRRAAPEIPVAAVIHHGIDPESFPMGDGDGGYLLFLGRMSPDKGIEQAIAAARDAGARLLIAAKMREPAERAYFDEHVEPLLGGDIEYLGEVGATERLDLLRGAVGLLNPSQWPEPFGLVMIEAFACGTPVIGRPIGSTPEILDDGLTGFLCTDHDDLVSAIGKVGDLRRQDCRDVVTTRFSTDRMVADHLALYADVLDAAPPPPPAAAAPLYLQRTA